MTKNFKYFLIPLLLSIPLWLGANVLQKRLGNFFYWLEMASNPVLLAAQESQMSFQNNIINLKPIRNESISDPKIEAKSIVSVFVNNQGRERILFEKEKDGRLPMASLTKLMTAK